MKTCFPILWRQGLTYQQREEFGDCPNHVTFEITAKNEERAQRNHGQTMKRLAERGGLAPYELRCVIEDRHWHPYTGNMRQDIDWLKKFAASTGGKVL